MSETITAGVIGGSGFTGGELLRIIDSHPVLTLDQATSRSYTGKSIGYVHPNLRHRDDRFIDPDDLSSVDILFTATPHGVSMKHIDEYVDVADTVVDLSADFRLSTEEQYNEWYDGHSAPDRLDQAVYALPEINRENLPQADLIAAGGCNATATIIGLYPLVKSDVITGSEQIVVDVKVGSSEGGAAESQASNHAERSGIVRPYAPTGHRHEAEIEEYLGVSVSFTAHAVDMIRGASATAHIFPEQPVTNSDLWRAYRDVYEDEPFVRMASGGGGVYRYPEPKVVAGSNYAEVGFEVDPGNKRLVVFSAIDNMMKGSAGQAVHAANIALGLDETAGLESTGFHPIGAP
ncbi:N-acetyl-gamma-glutamyl-phosphate reductase [Salinarchaeum sp. IM2453]|uniref:N-acetyl-gamma-glutamyl-phosphate reductase n=1 Tax=Salinarchaeum sp. IM2453 TaxID=2862870 RepID=UPI001C82EFB0|nr:N-acetyl-gamma-glutamyl-phosphate reductase [Salinarchaeum sp. IM2453]QZA89632.1 N-acetyl-gamma-glutamyl-phosphate reductase [Salinarchaeum sp. IM2453]